MRARPWLAAVGLAASSACAIHEPAREPGAGPCGRGLLFADGACLGPREADAVCGARSISVGGAAACAVPTCARGEALDPVALTCVAERAVRAIALRSRPLADDVVLGCKDDRVLVARGERVGCLTRDETCPWTSRPAATAATAGAAGASCVPEAPCAAGEVRSGASGTSGSDRSACVRVKSGDVVDVGAWARAVVEDHLCRSLGRHLSLRDGLRLGMSVVLVFPDNDVTGATGTALLDSAASDPPESEENLPAAAREAMDALLIPLRALGGTADAASASLHIGCAFPPAVAPRVLPRVLP